jgi:hypothetical protein
MSPYETASLDCSEPDARLSVVRPLAPEEICTGDVGSVERFAQNLGKMPVAVPGYRAVLSATAARLPGSEASPPG